MAFGTEESADKNRQSLEAPPDEQSCNSAICLECAIKYYEYIEESGEVVTNCVMCAQSLQLVDGSLLQSD